MLTMPSRSRACRCEWCRDAAGLPTDGERRILRAFLGAVALRALASTEAAPAWRIRRASCELRRSWRSDEIFASAEHKLGTAEMAAWPAFHALLDRVGLSVAPRTPA